MAGSARRSRVVGAAILAALALGAFGAPGAAWAESGPGGWSLTMVAVPAGRFQRSPSPGDVSVVGAFLMSGTEIPRGMFKDIMGVDPSRKDTSTSESDPVTMVNWYQALAFCNKLSLREGRSPAYAVAGVSDWAGLPYSSISTASDKDWNTVTCDWDSDGYRLPSEMEWMWAAMGAPEAGRGGGVDVAGHRKAFAGDEGTNQIGEYANVQSNNEKGILGPRPVARRKPNELGLYDMSGNVWEWCWDWFANAGGPHQNTGKGQDYKDAGVLVDYRGGASSDYVYGPHKVIRGGSFYGADYKSALGFRMISAPANASDSYGFRVARSK
ncbi:MAG: SUMF1/EgtB/PvdO family nonheme iron enzyme [Spirochaetaceae bacterium]|nr:SUMF1/EgtB/PvdO family nonheme iron enzyme [Spirochaetaceae bacterium]